jgi:hypothetical protein
MWAFLFRSSKAMMDNFDHIVNTMQHDASSCFLSADISERCQKILWLLVQACTVQRTTKWLVTCSSLLCFMV